MTAIKEFLVTGILGGIALGSSSDEVLAKWGNPKDVSVSRKPAIWRYGPIEISFDLGPSCRTPGPVAFMGIYFQNITVQMLRDAGFREWLPTAKTTYRNVKEFLDIEAISYSERTELNFGSQRALFVQSQVDILFRASSTDLFLDSMQLTRH